MVKSESHVTRKLGPGSGRLGWRRLHSRGSPSRQPKTTISQWLSRIQQQQHHFCRAAAPPSGPGSRPGGRMGVPALPSNKAVPLSMPHDHRRAAPLLTSRNCLPSSSSATRHRGRRGKSPTQYTHSESLHNYELGRLCNRPSS